MRSEASLIPEFHYCDACSAKLDVFVVGRSDTRYSCQILADDLPECSCTCAVKDADAGGVDPLA